MNKFEFTNRVRFATSHEKNRPVGVYLVGGAVRDMVFGFEPKDKDYCVTGITKEEFQQEFPEAKLVLGKDGKESNACVFLIEIEGKQTEVALARKEINTGPGYNDFTFVIDPYLSIEEELKRRDFTINAMAMDIETSSLIDPYNGVLDIQNKILRATSKAFKEDPLRILRGARFTAKYGLEIDEETIEMMIELAQELYAIPEERIVLELAKVFEISTPGEFFRILKKLGIHKKWDMMKEIFDLIGVEQPVQHHPEGDAFEHVMNVLDQGAIIAERENLTEEKRNEFLYAVLNHDDGKGVSPIKWERDPEAFPKGTHRGHERDGVFVAEALSDRLKVPKRWKQAAMFGAQFHTHVHRITEMKIESIIDLIEGKKNVLEESQQFIKEKEQLYQQGEVSYKKWEEFKNNHEHLVEKYIGSDKKKVIYQLEQTGIRKSALGVEGLAYLAEADAKGKGDPDVHYINGKYLSEIADIIGKVKLDASKLPKNVPTYKIKEYKKKLQKEYLVNNLQKKQKTNSIQK